VQASGLGTTGVSPGSKEPSALGCGLQHGPGEGHNCVKVFAVKAACPLVSGNAVKVEVVTGGVQGETAIFISHAAAARGVAEEVFIADLNLRFGAPVEAYLQTEPFLLDSDERGDFDRRGCVEDEMDADCATSRVRGFPESGEVFGVSDRRAEIEASILLRRVTVRAGLRASFHPWQRAGGDGGHHKGSGDPAARDVRHDAHVGVFPWLIELRGLSLRDHTAA
jgi:hypothetical protein